MLRILNKNKFNFIKYNFKINKVNLFSKKKKFLKLYIYRNFFVRLHFLFKKIEKNTKILFTILFLFFKNFWYLYITLMSSINYYNLLTNIFKKYYKLFIKKKNKFFIINNNSPKYISNHILSETKLKYTGIKLNNLNSIYKVEHYLLHEFKRLQLKKTKLFKDQKSIIRNKYILNSILYKKNDYSNSKFNLNFLRIQKRYNKRRYSKVRVTSRNSFFAGISLSSLFLAILWGGSIKNTDWFSASIVIIDINFILGLTFFYYLYRIYSIIYPTIFLRKKNKIKLIYNFQKLFTINTWYKK